MYERIQDILKQPKTTVFLAVVMFLMFIALITLGYNYSKETADVAPPKEVNQLQSFQQTKNTSEGDTPPITDIIVDVKGAVKRPQTYEMKSNQRVKDLLAKAGILENADLSQINLAEKLIDQKMFYIPKKGEIATEGMVSASNDQHTSSEQQPINLNLAKESDLVEVPGIGPSKAQAIIMYRDEKGAFKSVEDLKEVKGIGEKTFERLKDYFVV
ncbi:helix-hairpin-helix domain-containing protein [Staphylococcus ratti]|uniref:Helix-hairpin-helix domain-containing protein n=1 Tax=Staphylococcus ratti TaxID=2892440 RepID=A0ABY3PFF1_9STAP|nr:helix-hairpin-helix domain-containing protein [Staphylococcus ratti]UEX91068.1 helix-hairpin-helix domain-containing protein [Staphylococcus ratti]